MEEQTNLVPRLQQDAYLHDLAAAQPGTASNYFVCLYAECEALFSTAELLEQHIGVHAFPDTSRLARNSSAVDIACNDAPAVATKSDTYTPPLFSIAGYSEGYAGASSEYSELLDPEGDLPVVNNYNNNIYAPWAVTNTTAYKSPFAGLSNNYVAPPVDWSDPLDFGKNSFLPSGPQDSGKDAVALPALAGFSTKDTPLAHWHYSDLSRYTEAPLATVTAPFGNDILPNEHPVHINEYAGTKSPLRVSTSNGPLVPSGMGPPTSIRPMCTECNKTFGRQSDLERHAKIHQAGSNVFKCQAEGCTYSNYRKDKLSEHIRRRHSSEEAS